MTTVLRVKRRNEDQPQDALILCKRAKLTDGEDDDQAADSASIPMVAKFAGTLKDSEGNVMQHLSKSLNKEKLKAGFKQPRLTPHVLVKAREQARKRSAANRYKVVNCLRSVDTSNENEFEDKVMTFIDMEDVISLAACQDVATEKKVGCVYDLYYAETEKNAYIDDCEPIYALNDHELVFDTCGEDDLENEYKSEDSNSESNWRNDYPDTDESIDEDDMRRAVENASDMNDLSDEDETDEKEYFAYALDADDVERYGYKYARYKQRMKSLLSDDEAKESDSSDEETLDSSLRYATINNVSNKRNT